MAIAEAALQLNLRLVQEKRRKNCDLQAYQEAPIRTVRD